MTCEKIFNYYKNFLDALIDESDFFKLYFQCIGGASDICWHDYDEGSAFYDNAISLRFGATRGCFVPDNFDYVVKFDLPTEKEFGSCEDEMRIYEYAAQVGLEKFFAQPIDLGVYRKTITFYDCFDVAGRTEELCLYYFDEEEVEKTLHEYMNEDEIKEITIEIPLVAYPRAKQGYWYINDDEMRGSEEGKIVSSWDSPLTERNEAIGYVVARDYGIEVFEELSEFLREHDVNDLHSGNVMTLDGKIIFTDYCGFHDDY